MNIISGSGKKRSVFVFPTAEIVHRSPVEQQQQACSMLCRMLNVSEETGVCVPA